MSIPKILVIPARRHIIESYTDYIIRGLADEFYFEMGYPMEPPYINKNERIWGGTATPLEKNPDDFDLIYPHFSTHWFLSPPEKYAHKVAIVTLEPGQYSNFPKEVAVIGVTSEPLEKERSTAHKLRFGVDTNLFAPFKIKREDDLVNVGFIGNILTPRRYMKRLFIDALKDVPGIRLIVFPTGWRKGTRVDEIEDMGGQFLIDSIHDGDQWLTGLPYMYNQMDIFIRCDIEHGYQFSIMEAAACEVPVVCVHSGPSIEVTREGGGIGLDNGDGSWNPENLDGIAKKIREAVILLRDNPEKRREMGKAGRQAVIKNFDWNNWLPAWREFFREGLKNAKM